jgi:hypothetical protein
MQASLDEGPAEDIWHAYAAWNPSPFDGLNKLIVSHIRSGIYNYKALAASSTDRKYSRGSIRVLRMSIRFLYPLYKTSSLPSHNAHWQNQTQATNGGESLNGHITPCEWVWP